MYFTAHAHNCLPFAFSRTPTYVGLMPIEIHKFYAHILSLAQRPPPSESEQRPSELQPTNSASLGFIQRDGIDPTKSQESGRGDRGFYGAGERETSLKEIGAHGFKPHGEITQINWGRSKN